MKILCLHGVGSSGSVCASQFGPFLKAVDPSYEFVFVDGPIESERGPGMASYLEPPFFSHTTGYTPAEMREAHAHLSSLVADLGPFDGILGFSQGAALSISYLHHLTVTSQPLPFKFGLFFSSVIPCSADPDFCLPLIQRLSTHKRDLERAPSSSSSSGFSSGASSAENSDSEDSLPPLTRDERVFLDTLTTTVLPARKANSLLPPYDMEVYTSGNVESAPRIMVPGLLKERIAIPTIHVTGKRDAAFMRSMAETARGVCDEGVMRVLEHSGGHQPPQKVGEVRAAVRAMEWAIAVAERM